MKNTFPASINHLSQMMDFVCDHALSAGFPPPLLSHIELAAEEVLINIITHGYQDKTSESCTIDIECHVIAESGIKVVIKDRGVPFNPVEASKKTASIQEKKNIDKAVLGGYGIFLIFRMMDDVEYIYENGENILRLSKFHSK